MASPMPIPPALVPITNSISVGGLKQLLQAFFSDGLVIIVGSGLSAAEGIPGMVALAGHLRIEVPRRVLSADQANWADIENLLSSGCGLEAALLQVPPSPGLETIIVEQTTELLRSAEAEVFREVLEQERELRLSRLLPHVLKPPEGLSVVTPNYDRLIELAAEMANLGVDSMFVGSVVGRFNEQISKLSFLKNVELKGRHLRKHLRGKVNLFKPHGSLDWCMLNGAPVRLSLDLPVPRLIITPGLNKFRNGYQSPFDVHRDRANTAIDNAARFLILGYGFNDDHLETHLVPRLKMGRDCLLLTHTMTAQARKVAAESPGLVALEAHEQNGCRGTAITRNGVAEFLAGSEIWDLKNFVTEVLEP